MPSNAWSRPDRALQPVNMAQSAPRKRMVEPGLSAPGFAPTLAFTEDRGTSADEKHRSRSYRAPLFADPWADQCARPGVAGDRDADDRPPRAGVCGARPGGRRGHEAG